MRKVLILGGTAWLGRAIAAHAVGAGDDVTCLARGEARRVPAGARLVRSDRSRPGAYSGVLDGEWDDVIELSYNHGFVTAALDALGATARHWTLVSSVSVYASNGEADAGESAALHEPLDLDDYGHAKVAAERASTSAVGDRLLIARAGLIAGPGDGSDRFGYWVGRFALAGDGAVLVPDTGNRMVQFIDVDDLAAWLIAAGRRGQSGTFNAVGPARPLVEVLSAAAEVAGRTARTVTAADDWLITNDVRYWSGPRSLPLWLPAADVGFAQRNTDAFLAAGGSTRCLRETLARSLDDERARGLDRERRSGLSRAEELEVIARTLPSAEQRVGAGGEGEVDVDVDIDPDRGRGC
ncbi:nucleoside-diphosphate-sugar epimerase [Marisediminicola sp. UYEF4]|uniref:NAD-dependent epimerase/dehydratase family protein n=1 Tax=Marisediminicola sp. UYEF4 TaxID=1756384 RepID=UPI0033921F3C